MNFKDWIYSELSGSNAYQRMVRQHPGYQTMPKHVRDEFVNASLGHSVNSSSAKALAAKLNGQPQQPVMQPSAFLSNSPYANRQWSKKAEVLGVTPAHFDEKTVHLFVHRCFGYRPLPTIRNDLERMNHQQGALDIAMLGKNEPVVILQDNGGKLKLQEGWHRIMSMLVWDGNEEYGAPSDQIQLLKQYADKLRKLDQPFIDKYGADGLSTDNKARLEWLSATMPLAEKLRNLLDFSTWKPVQVRGFVGKMGQQAKSSSNPYDVGTADYDSEADISTGNFEMNPYNMSTAMA